MVALVYPQVEIGTFPSEDWELLDYNKGKYDVVKFRSIFPFRQLLPKLNLGEEGRAEVAEVGRGRRR